MSADDETKNPPLLYLFDIVHYDTMPTNHKRGPKTGPLLWLSISS